MAQQVTATLVPVVVTLIRNQRLFSVASYWSSVSAPGSKSGLVPVQVVQLVWSVDSCRVTPMPPLVPMRLPR